MILGNRNFCFFYVIKIQNDYYDDILFVFKVKVLLGKEMVGFQGFLIEFFG